MKKNEHHSISRRDFVKKASLGAAAVTAGVGAVQAMTPSAAVINERKNVSGDPALAKNNIKRMDGKPVIGFQAEINYVLEYGIERLLDDLQARAQVNTLFLYTHPYQASWEGIDKAKNPLGHFAAANPQYYKDIFMKPQGLGPSDFDLPGAMVKITEQAKKRNMKLYSWVVEDNRAPLAIAGYDELYEVDLHGRRTNGHPGGPCLNNPYFRNLLSGKVEDYIRSYGMDGLQRGSERQGPLSNALGAWHHGSVSDPGKTSCFCKFCTEKAEKQGIDVERVKRAFLVLEQFVNNGRAGKRPIDGYYVEFWRILLRYPELLIWETFWADSMREMQKAFYDKAKSVDPNCQIGFHIWHNASFNPIYRAEQDYQSYVPYADFLKPVVYDNSAAERMTSYIYSVGQNIYGDLDKEQSLQFHYNVMGYREGSYDQITKGLESYESQLRELPINGTPKGADFERFSSDYVLKETQRAVNGVAGSKVKIWPGIGIDVVLKNSTPESVRDVVYAVFQGGGTGMVLSTSHAAMRPENLSAVGSTLTELGMNAL